LSRGFGATQDFVLAEVKKLPGVGLGVPVAYLATSLAIERDKLDERNRYPRAIAVSIHRAVKTLERGGHVTTSYWQYQGGKGRRHLLVGAPASRGISLTPAAMFAGSPSPT
jgi:hypothetical protein